MVPFACLADLGEDLLAAVRKGDAARVKALLAQGADVNAKSPYGATGLFFAADRGNVEIIRILLDHGANVNVKDTFYGATALSWATQKERWEVIKLLLGKGATAGADDVLMTAVEKGNAEIVKAVLEKKDAIPAETLSGALGAAIKNNQKEIAGLLTKAGVSPPVKPNLQIDPQALQTYAGSYSSEGMELKFEIVDGKLTGGPIGQKPTAYDAIDVTTFQHPEFPVKLAFTVEAGKVVSLAVKQGDGNAMVFKKTGAQ
ncbi:MAG TPA: ankyrin repeat domain-containing protein [Bryobacteraceae bacterium]|jgi:ankyrin repeat protein|nr:ankyrin repeat domain-containing protein [Bryobacteraceae bacterium]